MFWQRKEQPSARNEQAQPTGNSAQPTEVQRQQASATSNESTSDSSSSKSAADKSGKDTSNTSPNAREMQRLAMATFAKAFGSATYEVGANYEKAQSSNTQGDNSTVFNLKGAPLLTRINLGIRAMVNRRGDDLLRDENTLKMTDYSLFKQLKQELNNQSKDEHYGKSDEAMQRQMALMARVQEAMADRPFSNPEKQSIMQVAQLALNVYGLDKETQYANLITTYEQLGDTQYEKVRSDAMFRWRALSSNMALASLCKPLAAASSAVLTPLGSIFGLGAAEAYGQTLIKNRMDSKCLETTTQQLEEALNKELHGFFAIDAANESSPKPLHPEQANKTYSTNIHSTNFVDSPLGSLLQAEKKLAALESNTTSSTSEKTVALEAYVKQAGLVLTNYLEIEKYREEAGGKLSAATIQQYMMLNGLVDDSLNKLQARGLDLSFTRGSESATERQQALAVVLDSVIAKQDPERNLVVANFVNAVHAEELQRIQEFSAEKAAELKAATWGKHGSNFWKKTALNSLGNAFAVFAGGMKAIGDSLQFRGHHQIPVRVDEAGHTYMELRKYISAHAAESFGKFTGLDRVPGLDGISNTIGDLYSRFVAGEGWNALGGNEAAFNALFQRNAPGSEAIGTSLSIKEFFSGEALTQADLGAPFKRFADSTWTHFRTYDFGSNQRIFQSAIDKVADVALGLSGVMSVASVSHASKVSNSDISRYTYTQGYIPPKFSSLSEIAAQGSSSKEKQGEPGVTANNGADGSQTGESQENQQAVNEPTTTQGDNQEPPTQTGSGAEPNQAIQQPGAPVTKGARQIGRRSINPDKLGQQFNQQAPVANASSAMSSASSVATTVI